MPSNLTLRTLTAPGLFSPAWLLCEVSGFSPVDVLLTWLKGQQEMEPSQFATAQPTPQDGRASFRTWSALRVSSLLDDAGATYTCVVSHEASRTLLNGSCSLDPGGESYRPGAARTRGGEQRDSPEALGSRDAPAKCRGPPGSGSPTAAPLAPDTCPHATHRPRKGRRCCLPPMIQAVISHQDMPATGCKAGASPGLGVRAATLNSCPLGTSKTPQLPSPPPFWEPSQHLGGHICWTWAPRGF